jgi:hypothetical protein
LLLLSSISQGAWRLYACSIKRCEDKGENAVSGWNHKPKNIMRKKYNGHNRTINTVLLINNSQIKEEERKKRQTDLFRS